AGARDAEVRRDASRGRELGAGHRRGPGEDAVEAHVAVGIAEALVKVQPVAELPVELEPAGKELRMDAVLEVGVLKADLRGRDRQAGRGQILAVQRILAGTEPG